ncbi:YwiC-like family protein [Ilumatobacter sp.]|uniref:YwiC-like family protein n=1 Tax=Ilumatobacter sp. TaxID=1967498 RepID=UPI003C49F175
MSDVRSNHHRTASTSTGHGSDPTGRRRSTWRAVAIPSEHGGWGLTAEPILLGLIIGFSWPGVAVGTAALLAFLVRTPLKLYLVDRRRGRTLERTRLAARVAGIELGLIVALTLAAISSSGSAWLIPIAAATPFVATELWFDVRSRGRRLVPEVSGSIGIASVAAAIVVAGGGSVAVAVGAWLILGARATTSIPFVRTQIMRLRHGTAPLVLTDVLQAVGVVVAGVAVAVEPTMIVGAAAVAAVAIVQFCWLRREFVPPAKVLGTVQMVLGLIVVAATAIGVGAL